MKKATRLSTESESPQSFRAMGLSSKIIDLLTEADLVVPTEIQSKAIPMMLQGKDIIGISPTASGKTLTFSLPILDQLTSIPISPNARSLFAVVITPSRELAQQIHHQWNSWLSHFNLRAACFHGGGDLNTQCELLKRGVDLVVSTPGRLHQLIKKRPADFRFLNHLILDEADKILDMGLVPEIRQILKAIPKATQKSLFSATWPKELHEISQKFLRQPSLIQVKKVASESPSGLSAIRTENRVPEFFYDIDFNYRADFLLHWLRTETFENILIFVEQKTTANRLYDFLNSKGILCQRTHADRTPKQRENAMADFLEGRNQILIATDLVARGIHHAQVSHVIHYDPALNHEDHVHRVGRAGRSEKVQGKSIMLGSPKKKKNIQKLFMKLKIQASELKAPKFKKPAKPSLPFIEKATAATPKTNLTPKVLQTRRGESGFIPPSVD